jgi:hypothetical protein
VLLLAAGRGTARILRVREPGAPATFALGAAVASLLSLGLLAIGAFRVPLLAAALLLPFLVSRPPRSVRVSFGRVEAIRASLGPAILIACGAAVLFVRSAAPLTANDPIVYHATLARGYAETGGLGGAPDLVYAHMPHGGDLLFAGAYLLGGETAARMLHAFLAIACAALAAALAREVAGAASGAGAAALFLTLPLVLDPRTVGNADLPAALFFGGSFLFVLRHAREGRKSDLVAASLLAGGMLSAKLAAYAAYPILLAPLALQQRHGAARSARLRGVAAFLLLSHAALAPWLLRAWRETGNPLFPLFPSWLGGRGWDEVLGDRLLAWQRSIGMGRDPLHYVLLPWNAILRGAPNYGSFDGVLSPALLLFAAWAWVRGGRTARMALVLSLGGIYLWGLGSQQLRFLLPVVLLLSSLAGGFWRSERGAFGRFQGMAFLAVCALLVAPEIGTAARDTLPVVVGREGRETYLERKIQSYAAFREVESIVPAGEKVLLAWENRVYYARRPYAADSFFEASALVRRAERAGTRERLLIQLKDEGIGWILVNRSLERVFGRYAPPEALALLDEAWSACEPAGSWKGIELYRMP